MTEEDADITRACVDALRLVKVVETKLKGKSNFNRWISDLEDVFTTQPGWLKSLTSASTLSSEEQNVIRSVLYMTMDPKVRQSVKTSTKNKSPQEVYEHCKKKFGTASKLKAGIARSKFYGTPKNQDESVATYILSKKTLAETIESCGETVPEKNIVEVILIGTRLEFGSVVESLVEKDADSLTLDYVESRLADAEEARGSNPGRTVTFKGAINTIQEQDPKTGIRPTCDYCKKSGHPTVKCYKRVRDGIAPCPSCHTTAKGHSVTDCRKKNIGSSAQVEKSHIAHLSQLVEQAVHKSLAVHLDLLASPSSANTPTNDKYSTVRDIIRANILRQRQEHSLSIRLVADSGATSSIFSRQDDFSDYKSDGCSEVQVADERRITIAGRGKKPINFALPDGRTNRAQVAGLHVPETGETNLLSVSKSVNGKKAFIFDETGCSLYNNTTRAELHHTTLKPSNLAAVGDIDESGLYIMRTSPPNKPVAASQSDPRTQLIYERLCLITAPSQQAHLTLCRHAQSDTEQARLSLHLMHKRLGHRHLRDVRKLCLQGHNGRKPLVKCQEVAPHSDTGTTRMKSILCKGCALGKAKKIPLPKKRPGDYKVRDLLELIHTDVCGPFPVMAIAENAYYFVTFIEDRSRMKFSYLLRRKNEVFEKWKTFSHWIERHTGKPIKILRFDNAGEHLSLEFRADLSNRGIASQRTCAGSSNQNQVAEKWNGTAMDAARALLAQARLPLEFWGHALLSAAYVSQFWSHPTIADITVHEAFHGSVPNIDHLRIFGCDAYAYNDSANKLCDRSQRHIFVGYPAQQKGYLLYDPQTGRVRAHRNVIFDETSFGGRTLADHWEEGYENEAASDSDFLPIDTESDSDDEASGIPRAIIRAPLTAAEPELRRSTRKSQPRDFYAPMVNIDTALSDDESSILLDTGHRANPALYIGPNDVAQPARRIKGRRLVGVSNSHSQRRATIHSLIARRSAHRKALHNLINRRRLALESPAHTDDYGPRSSHEFAHHVRLSEIAALVQSTSRDSDDLSRYGAVTWLESVWSVHASETSDDVKHSPTDIISSNALPVHYVPTSYRDALSCADRDRWQAAIADELASLDSHGTFEDARSLPEGVKPIGCKWVFKIKMKPDPNGKDRLIIDRYKARLVLQGFKQRPGVDFKETFAPVVRADTLRLLLALSLEDPSLELHQMDVHTAFLESDIDVPIYMVSPKGYSSSAPFVRLRKTLYGLKQAPRAFHQTMEKYLLSCNFTKVASVNCVYIYREQNEVCIIALYVDDLILVGHKDLISRIKTQLSSRFTMKDLGALSFALGISIQHNPVEGTIGMSQAHYIEETLKEHGFSQCRPAQTPAVGRLTKEMSPRTAAERADVQREFWKLDYRKAIGQLLWICSTRPDISFAVGQTARFVHDPGREHYLAVKRILRYLRGTSDLGLQLTRSRSEGGPLLSGYADSDYAGDPDTCRSTFGYLLRIGRSLVSFKSKLAPTVALSSCESEYVAACVAAQEAVFFRSVLEALGFPQSAPTKIFEDNQSCIAHCRNLDNHTRMKHIDIKKYYVRELVQANVIEHEYIPTTEMVADLFTKPLGVKLFSKFRSMIGVVSV